MMRKTTEEHYGAISDMELKRPYVKVVHALFMIISLFLSAICLLPLVWLMLSAFKDTKEFLQIPPTFMPKNININKLLYVWKLYHLAVPFLNTVYLAAGNIMFTVVFNGLAGYVLSRLKPKGARLVFMVILLTMLLPNNVSQVPLFMTFTHFPVTGWNLSNTYWPMWLMSGANSYYILLFKSFFDSISISYFESAKLDGCSNLQMFYKLVIPLSLPVIAAISIFEFNGAWGSYFWPLLLLTDGKKQVIGQQLYNLKTSVPIDVYCVAMFLVIIPPSVIYFIFQKQIMGGLTVGGVKG